jgi:predicted HTH transcriptional regulator
MTDLTDMLAAPEDKRLEFKRDASSLKPILKTLVAFANTAGGTLVIGRDDNGNVRGVPDSQAVEEKLASAISDGIAPSLFPDIEVATAEGRELIVVRVSRWPGPFYLSADGPEQGVYVRLGSTNRRADAATLAALKREAEQLAFDQHPCVGADLGDLDIELARRLFAAQGREIDEAKLESLGVLIRYGSELVPSNGGMILFGSAQARQRRFPDAQVRCARFKGTGKADFLDQLDIEASVLGAVDEAARFVRRNTRLASKIESLHRQDVPEYPALALREALVNAVAHTDYQLTGMNIRVAVFDDRLEIESPGTLPFGLTVEDLKSGVSRIRNPVIARVLRELTLMEKWGSGYRRIREDCAVLGHPLPEWVELGSVVRCVFPPHPEVVARGATPEPGPIVGTKSGPSRDQVVLLALAREPKPISDLMAVVGWRHRTKFRDKLLRPLLDSGLIAMTEPDKPTSSRQRYVTTELGIAKIESVENTG